MNIHIYLGHFPPKGDKLNEGLTKAVHGLASGFVACGAQVTVLSELSGSHDSIYETEAGYIIRCFPNPIKNRPSFKTSANLKQYICKHLDKNSFVILNGIMHPNVYCMSRLMKKHGVPYVVAPHDPYNPAFFSRNAHLKVPYWYLLERRMLRQATAIQVLDTRHSKWLYQLGVHNPVIAVPNGFAPEDLNLDRCLQWQQNGIAKLFFLGRIDSYNKGLDLLINAFAQITDIDEKAHLTIQGPDWGNKKRLQAQVKKLSINKQVSFFEPDYDKSPSSLIQDHDIFCIPSRFEGFSLAALEAMLAGRVLLVSEIAGIAPHVRASGCGVVVAPEISEIKSGLIELLKRRSEWKEMGLRGRNYALKHLNWNEIASEALKKYNKLLQLDKDDVAIYQQN